MPLTIDLPQILKAASEAAAAGLHVCLPGVVESYNPALQSASIKPTIRNPIADIETGDQDSEDPVTIPNVPIVYPRGGGFHLYFPMEKGDHVVLVFSDLATGQWRTNGGIAEALDLRRHSLSYPFAIPGAFPVEGVLLDAVNPLYSGKMTIGTDEDPTGCIRIGPGSIELGGLLPTPLAMATQNAAALNAIVTAVAGIMNGLAPGTGTTFQTAVGLLIAAIPSTITKGQ